MYLHEDKEKFKAMILLFKITVRSILSLDRASPAGIHCLRMKETQVYH